MKLITSLATSAFLLSLNSFAEVDSSPVSCRVHTKSSWQVTDSVSTSKGLELIEEKIETPFGTSYLHKLDVDARRYLVVAIVGDLGQASLLLTIQKKEGKDFGPRLASANLELVSKSTVSLNYGEDRGIDEGAEIFCKLK